jgi:hypothetical protein
MYRSDILSSSSHWGLSGGRLTVLQILHCNSFASISCSSLLALLLAISFLNAIVPNSALAQDQTPEHKSQHYQGDDSDAEHSNKGVVPLNTVEQIKDNRLRTNRQALNPAKTWLFCVGILTYGETNVSWSAKNRRDLQLINLMKHRGVPVNHIIHITDRDGFFSNIAEQFPPFLERTQSGDLLIDYFTGHGGVGSFETCDGGSYKHAWIARQINKHFNGSQVLLLADCCESGSLEDIVERATGPIAYACVSSSSRKECGNGNWTFSQAVLDALRGEPIVDLNNDGYITIDELAAHVKHDIAMYETNDSVYKKTANFDGQMIIAKTKPRLGPDPKPVWVLFNEKWYRAKEIERSGTKARIRWIELGYDSPNDDSWVDIQDVDPIRMKH